MGIGRTILGAEVAKQLQEIAMIDVLQQPAFQDISLHGLSPAQARFIPLIIRHGSASLSASR